MQSYGLFSFSSKGQGGFGVVQGAESSSCLVVHSRIRRKSQVKTLIRLYHAAGAGKSRFGTQQGLSMQSIRAIREAVLPLRLMLTSNGHWVAVCVSLQFSDSTLRHSNRARHHRL